MNGKYKEERIALYGEEKYKEYLGQSQEWRRSHPENVKARNAEYSRKGGKFYHKKVEDDKKELRRKRNIIRACDRKRYRKFKNIIAPESQIHHEWLPESPSYGGMALVEADQHAHGFIDVIQILEGEISIFTEAGLLS